MMRIVEYKSRKAFQIYRNWFELLCGRKNKIKETNLKIQKKKNFSHVKNKSTLHDGGKQFSNQRNIK
jgi:hypothetical protein